MEEKTLSSTERSYFEKMLIEVRFVQETQKSAVHHWSSKSEQKTGQASAFPIHASIGIPGSLQICQKTTIV